MAEPALESVASQPSERVAFEFRGTASEYFRIWIVNLSLTILTLGIYSAWAKVRRNRYLAASTRVGGASFAYLAEPMAILKGRALVVGFFLVYSMAQGVSPLADAVFGPAIFLAIPWAVIRSMAFRAHNTAWRNVRFAFGAPYGAAFGAYIGYPLLGALTLGVLYPNAVFRQRRFLVDNSAFGTTRFQIGSSNRDFYRAFGMIVMLALVLAATAGVVWSISGRFWAAAVASVPMGFYLFGYAASQISNHTYHGATLGPHRLRCRLEPGPLALLYASNALAILLSLGLLIPWAHIRSARYRLSRMGIVAAGSLDEFAAAQGDDVSSLGDAFGEMMDLDIGL